MLVDNDKKDCYTLGIHFDMRSGQVRLVSASGVHLSNRLLFRVDGCGIYVWDKEKKQEVLIPWEQVEGWKSRFSTS